MCQYWLSILRRHYDHLRPRFFISVISIANLNDTENRVIVTLLLNEIVGILSHIIVHIKNIRHYQRRNMHLSFVMQWCIYSTNAYVWIVICSLFIVLLDHVVTSVLYALPIVMT